MGNQVKEEVGTVATDLAANFFLFIVGASHET